MVIKALDGKEPHESWGGWAGFLASCEVRDKADGVTHYGKSNCNYLVFPDGTLMESYSVHAQNIMDGVKAFGATVTLETLHSLHAALKAMANA